MILSVMACLLLFTKYENNFQSSNQTTGLAWGMLTSRRMAVRQSREAGGHADDPPDGTEAVPRIGRARSKERGSW